MSTVPEHYPGKALQPLFDLMSEHGLTLLEDEMFQIINTVEAIRQPELKDHLNDCMGLLIDAHNLLAKSDMGMDKYKPISIKLAEAKLELAEIIAL